VNSSGCGKNEYRFSKATPWHTPFLYTIIFESGRVGNVGDDGCVGFASDMVEDAPGGTYFFLVIGGIRQSFIDFVGL